MLKMRIKKLIASWVSYTILLFKYLTVFIGESVNEKKLSYIQAKNSNSHVYLNFHYTFFVL